MNSLDKMSEALNTTFSPATIKQEITTIKQETKELANIPKKDIIPNKALIESEFKDIITKASSVLNTISQDIKIGSTASMHMAFAELIKANVNTLKTLFDINKSIYEMELMQNNTDPDKETDPKKMTLSLTPADLKNMVDLAQKESELNKVDADFKISEVDEK